VASILDDIRIIQQQLLEYRAAVGGSVDLETLIFRTTAGEVNIDSNSSASDDDAPVTDEISDTFPLGKPEVTEVPKPLPDLRPFVCIDIRKNLYRGVTDRTTNDEVSKLQEFLRDTGDYTYPVITGYFGPATEEAVKRFQANNQVVSSGSAVTTGYGVVGPLTRITLKKRCEIGSAWSRLIVTLDPASPAFKLALAGTSGVEVSKLQVTVSGQSALLKTIALQLTSGTPGDIMLVTIWDGSTQVGQAIFTGSNKTAIGVINGNVLLSSQVPKTLTLKADLAQIGLTKTGTPGSQIRVDYDNDNESGTTAQIVQTKKTIIRTSTKDSSSEGVQIQKSYPVINLVNLPTTRLVSGRADLFMFKISAVGPAGYQIGIDKITFYIATSSLTHQVDMVDNVNVYAYRDQNFSIPVSGLQNDGSLSKYNLDLSLNGGTLNIPWVNYNTDLEICAQNLAGEPTTVIIPAGSSYYFTIRGDVRTAGSIYNVSTQLQGDARGLSVSNPKQTPDTFLLPASKIDKSRDNDFIWRPFSTTTLNNANANDFTNGFAVPGLPPTNTNVETLTQ